MFALVPFSVSLFPEGFWSGLIPAALSLRTVCDNSGGIYTKYWLSKWTNEKQIVPVARKRQEAELDHLENGSGDAHTVCGLHLVLESKLFLATLANTPYFEAAFH